MKLLHGFDDPSACRGGVVSIGNFDGVHRGHRTMIASLVRRARDVGGPAVVLTFEPHPTQLLRPQQAPPRLSTLTGKADLIRELGVDCLIAYPTDWNLLQLTPAEFFERIIRGELHARGLVEGANFFFGRNRAGDVETLRRLCDAAGLILDIVPPVEVSGRTVSSSAIRSLIAEGRMGQAVEMLGHPYRVEGRVVSGADRGHKLGFPTANLAEVRTLIPGDGVYAGRARVEEDDHPAAIHVGPSPTFSQDDSRIEVHVIDFSGRLYGETLQVDFLERLREIVRFENVDALRDQLRQDVETARTIATAPSGTDPDD